MQVRFQALLSVLSTRKAATSEVASSACVLAAGIQTAGSCRRTDACCLASCSCACAGSSHPDSRYLLAHCCMLLGKLSEAEQALNPTNDGAQVSNAACCSEEPWRHRCVCLPNLTCVIAVTYASSRPAPYHKVLRLVLRHVKAWDHKALAVSAKMGRWKLELKTLLVLLSMLCRTWPANEACRPITRHDPASLGSQVTLQGLQASFFTACAGAPWDLQATSAALIAHSCRSISRPPLVPTSTAVCAIMQHVDSSALFELLAMQVLSRVCRPPPELSMHTAVSCPAKH